MKQTGEVRYASVASHTSAEPVKAVGGGNSDPPGHGERVRHGEMNEPMKEASSDEQHRQLGVGRWGSATPVAGLAERWPRLFFARPGRLDEPHPLKKTCERQGAESARGIVGS